MSNCFVKKISGFQKWTALGRIEIPSSGSKNASLAEVVFASDFIHNETDGFHERMSFCRIEIPSSVEIIVQMAFVGCASLNELLFSSNCNLKEIDGFQECAARWRIPTSVKIICHGGFSGCTSL
jgi:hypothetical protein